MSRILQNARICALRLVMESSLDQCTVLMYTMVLMYTECV